jgi:catechol 2,3-dioxygenase-like lactoylglutathione lyase family enzyme
VSLAPRIDSIFVPARDTRGAADWYRDVFGLTELFESAGYIGLGFAGGGTALTLYPAESVDGGDHFRFNFYAPDPEALHAALESAGAAPTPISTSGPIRYFEFRDIAGNRVNVCHVIHG